jgi:type IV pilus assembly protein PilB
MTRKRLGELLLQEGLINEKQLDTGLEEQKQTGELIGEILVRKGYVTESDIARTISTQFSVPYLSVSRYYIAPEMLSLFSLQELERNLFVPIDRFGDVVTIVVAGLLDQEVLDTIERQVKGTLQVYVGTVTEVKSVIKDKFAAAARTAAKAAQAKGASASKSAAAATAVQAPPDDVTAPPRAGASLQHVAPPDGGDDSVVKQLEEELRKFLPTDDSADKDKK